MGEGGRGVGGDGGKRGGAEIFKVVKVWRLLGYVRQSLVSHSYDRKCYSHRRPFESVTEAGVVILRCYNYGCDCDGGCCVFILTSDRSCACSD